MTCIEKLFIQGVRSFDTQKGEVIEFAKPLTLIVGPNGSGKTTIIECLKFATTGELPPDSKLGQAFVHDPRLVHEKEVKAQVKLRFKTVNDKPIICIRALQLIQKANTQSIKTLDSVLQTYNAQGERISQSYKCADFDKEIPELMGVSKAILTNVIFCHQEESNWPLEESASIKKRFDAIFASTRYTKALEVIHGQKKDLLAQIKENKLKLELYENQLSTAKAIRKEVSDFEDQSSKLQEEIQGLMNSIESKEKMLSNLNKAKESANSDINEIARLKQTRSQLTNEIKAFGEDFSETLEELEDQLRNFSSDTELLKPQKDECERKKRNLLEQRKSVENEMQAIGVKWGQAQSSQRHLKELIAMRDQNILTFADEYRMTKALSIELPVSEEVVKIFLGKVRTLYERVTEKLKTFQEFYQTEEAERKQELDRLTMENLTMQSVIGESKRKISSASESMAKIAEEMEEKQSLYSSLETIENKVKQSKEKLDKIQQNFNKEVLESQSLQLKEEKKDLEKELISLKKEAQKLALYSEQCTTLKILNNSLEDKNKMIEKKKNSHSESFAHFFPDGIEDKSVKEMLDAIKVISEENQRQIKAEKRNLDDSTEKINILKGQNSSIDFNVKKKKEKVEEIKKLFEKKGVGSQLNELIVKADSRIKEYQNEITRRQSAQVLYQNFIELGKKNHSCPLCSNHLSDEDKFVEALKATLEEVPAGIAENQKKLDDAESGRKKLMQLLPDWDTLSKEEKEIPELEKQLEDYKTKEEKLSYAINKHKANLETLNESEKKIKVLSLALNEMSQIEDEKNKIAKNIATQKSKLPSDFLEQMANLHSNEDLIRDIEKLEKEIKAIDETVSENYRSISTNSSLITSLTKEVAKGEKEVASMRTFNEDITRLKDKNEEYTTIINEEKKKIKELEPKHKELLQKLNVHKKLISDKKEEYDEQSKSFVADRERFLEKQSVILSQQGTIEKTQEDNKQALAFEELESSKSKLQSQLDSFRSEITKLEDSINSLNEKISQGDLRRMNIKEKIKHRNNQENLQKCRERIDMLTRKLENIGVDTDIDAKLKEIQQELISSRTKRDKFQGAVSTHKESVKRKNKELQTQYSNVDQIYRNQLITVQTNEMAHTDLEKYYKALDKALMKYHQLKMTEINSVLKELWQATYRGNDIEAIEIRAELSDTVNRRQFNYRVVMLKESIAVDMRGRCSAGQKVLASLIIRLALAETFCMSCGILALDEPTTNLDRNNVESFANALVGIIENRKKSRSFQLIVITHDEEFVQSIGRSEHAEHYYRVTKNQEKHSVIEKFKIMEL